MMPRLSDRLTSIAASGSDRLAALRAVRQLRAPQGAIGAGYIRAAVWDHLCGCRPSPVDDVDVLYHDLDERPGSKFATADLIGIPYQVMVGPKSLAEGKVELKRRADGSRDLVTPEEAIARLTK